MNCGGFFHREIHAPEANRNGSGLTTERYDNQKLEALQAAVERLEGGKKFDAPDLPDNVSSFFQVPAMSAAPTALTPHTTFSELTDRLSFGMWLAKPKLAASTEVRLRCFAATADNLRLACQP
jgi:hypothetical protein